MKMLLAAALFAASAVAAPASAVTITFADRAPGVNASPFIYPEATFSSSTGTFFVGAGGNTGSICALTPGFDCSGTVNAAFNDAVSNLSFFFSGGDDTGAVLTVTGLAGGSAFSFDSVLGGLSGTIDLSAYAEITSIAISSTDPAGLAYDDFTFDVVGGSVVPEASTWAMMIGGFGLVGGALRRRSTRTDLARA